MRKSRFSEAQIVQILAEYDAGAAPEELARRHGVHANTIRLWRSKYGGMSTSDLARLKQLESECAQMQRIIARQPFSIDSCTMPRQSPSTGLASASKINIARVWWRERREMR